MSWIRVCAAAEVPANTAKKFWVAGGIPMLIVNYGSGFRAMPPVCPHMEEPLEDSGVVANCILTCTKHLWAWNLQTLEMQGETERPLQVYEVKQEGGDVFARVDKEILYDFEKDDDMDDDAFFNKS
ncbi:MAG: (2Fe-2S)-binding protein [Hyphomicrobium sp.]|nr:(2Fe-2S)-binding protein [Hyphomicrobium sp.]PPC83850.1 MAG: (2Fe-2S)-binding protein [Hyphomicrobium sp.]